MRSFLTVSLTASAAMLAGCSSLSSVKAPVADNTEGLVYYLPKRDIKIDVKVKDGVLEDVTIGLTPAYADHANGPYLLKYNANGFGKHKLELEVSPAGLLKSASATAEDRISGLANFGKLAGYVRGFSGGLESSPSDKAVSRLQGICGVDGTHVILFEAAAVERNLCGNDLKLKIEPLFASNPPVVGNSRAVREEHSGIFYRMGKPYRVSISGRIATAAIVQSPSNGEELFLPVARTVFATNEAKITIHDGEATPAKYTQETEGEVSAFLKIPATIIAPYFEAIGSVFSGFSKKATDETSARNNLVALELAKQKQAECYKAIRDRDTAAIEAMECGK